ncbi:MAG: hypothetical protein WA916_07385 [Arcobacter sp.]|uniref:hypothetical protein n=1 Tax=Arcobacter sp. TaxID=1872629 RepID=UPI003C762598
MDKKTNIESICIFLGITKKTWYNWKKEERPVTKFIEKYLSNEEIVEFINNTAITNYEVYKNANSELYSQLSTFCHPKILGHENFSKKLYFDFIFRFRNEISQINPSKENIIILLYKYQVILIEISKTINFPLSKIYNEIYTFINYFNQKDEIFIIFFIDSIKHNFKNIYLNKDAQDIPYFENNSINTDIKHIQYLNTFPSLYKLLIMAVEVNNKKTDSTKLDFVKDKDFFEVYEDYLKEQYIK